MQLVNEPTHLHPTPTLLDLAITNMTGIHGPAVVLPDPVADHQPVLLSARFPRERPLPPTPATRRRWESVNWNALNLSLLNANWRPVYEEGGVTGKVAAFMAVWDTAVNDHCPLATVRRRRPACPLAA